MITGCSMISMRLLQSILYTATSGIWRTVWLEPVPTQHITQVDMIPDVDKKLLNVKVHGSSDAVMLDLKFRVTDAGKEVAVATGRVDKLFQVRPANRLLPCRCCGSLYCTLWC